jgi:HD superfamily phosphohydrolase
MSSIHHLYEIRCPVHGFIAINDWEREIIEQPAFQRLRRIRQLAWTDQVYPGAMHNRFEHSLGVMHVATQLYDSIVARSRDILIGELAYNDDGLKRDRILVRLTALLHDVGHAPFSHAAEELFPPRDENGGRFEHEDYSAAIIRTELHDSIENHPLNQNYRLSADDIASLLEGNSRAGRASFWRELISGQMDADRMDYLLRDSLHAGVDYGRFDWRRLIASVGVVRGGEHGGPRLGVDEGGFHAAEGLVLARYFMFTQIYFHKTRVAYDHHLRKAMTEILPGGLFPRPTPDELPGYLDWNDWKVLGLLAGGGGGDHGARLARRDHYREVYHTPESPSADDFARLDRVRDSLGSLLLAEGTASKSWYKVGVPDIPVISDSTGRRSQPLSSYSSMVGRLAPIDKVMLYSRREDIQAARSRVEVVEGVRR